MTPIFAKKSAPPPPPEEGTKTFTDGKNGSGSPAFSTPSSSLLDTSNENSSAVANSTNPSPAFPSRPDERPDEEPMEQDPDSTPRPSASHSGTQKKVRNRSRSQRAEGKKSGPDVPSLLAALEDPNLPPLPPLPSAQPIPPPPPPPPAPPAEAGMDPPSKKTARTKRGEKEKDKKSDEQSGKIAQRTMGRIPRMSKHHNDCSGNDTASKAGSPLSSQQQAQNSGSSDSNTTTSSDLPPSSSSSSSAGPSSVKNRSAGSGTPSSDRESRQQHHQQNQQDENKGSTNTLTTNQSAYNTRPNAADNICLDISSYRFVPEDDRRIAILLRKMKGDTEGRITDGSTLRHVLHQFPTVFSNEVTGIPLDEAPGASLFRDDNDKFLSISEFATVEQHTAATFHTIARREALVFVIVSRHEQARGMLAWDIPSLAICQDFSNDFISRAFEGDNWDWTRSYIRSGRWGKVGTVILSSDSVEKLSEFRRQFALHTYKNMVFDTYPKDVLTAKADVSILLRSSMKTFKTEMIPKILFARNQDIIAGSLRVLSTRHHAADEKSHKGESKENWRSIELKGNDQFMRCLRLIPENQALLLGYDAIQIRGGLRPQDHNTAAVAGSKRAWSDIPAAPTPLLQDPRNLSGPATMTSAAAAATQGQPNRTSYDENAPRGSFKRGRAARGNNRRRGRGRFGRN